MRLKIKFLLNKIVDDYYAVPVENNNDVFSGVIRLNETGRDIFQGCLDGKDDMQITRELTEKYGDLDINTARKAVEETLEKLRSAGILVE